MTLKMQVSVIRQTYNSTGRIAVHSFIGDLLTLRLGNYGSAVKEIDITVCFRHAKRNPKPTLEDLFDDFHKYVKTLPRTTFYRKAKRIEIDFVSDNFTAEYEESGRKCPQNAIERASAALDRMDILYSRSKMGRKQKAAWKTALATMREKLDAMAGA